jgi:hypothetical protein
MRGKIKKSKNKTKSVYHSKINSTSFVSVANKSLAEMLKHGRQKKNSMGFANKKLFHFGV